MFTNQVRPKWNISSEKVIWGDYLSFNASYPALFQSIIPKSATDYT